MMVQPQIKQDVQSAWQEYNELQDKMNNATFSTSDAGLLEMLKIKIQLLQADALATIAARQQGPW